MYLYGAAAALLASFVLVAVFMGAAPVDTSTALHPALQRPPSRLARCCQALLPALRSLSVGLLLLCIATGFFGTKNPYLNFNMTLFWIGFVLLFTYFTAFVGDVFRFVSPWRVITDALPSAWRSGRYDYPKRLAYWPALLLYIGFISVELFAKTTPQSLAGLLLGYSIVNVLGVILLGQRAWFRYIEFFSVFLRLVAMMAPLQWRQGRLLWRMPFSGLNGRRAESYSLVVFILFMLASTAFDGLRGSIIWVNMFWADTFNILTPWLGKPPVYFYVQLRPWYTVYELAWLWLSPLIYFVVFMVFVVLARVITGTAVSTREMALRLSFSLLPIALVYHLTHYYTLIFTQGVKIISLLSDPFGWGWNLFGTLDVFRRPLMPDMAWIWHSQVGLIVFGHIVSVYIAHREATVILNSSRQAAISQLPMLVLMMLLTASGLWILSQPMSGSG